jgi:hypothetical protein
LPCIILLPHGKDIFAVCWRTAVFVGTAKNIFPVVSGPSNTVFLYVLLHITSGFMRAYQLFDTPVLVGE